MYILYLRLKILGKYSVFNYIEVKEFRIWHRNTLEEKLERKEFSRQSFWSKAIAVGDSDWLKETAVEQSGVKRYNIVEMGDISYVLGKKPHDKLIKA